MDVDEALKAVDPKNRRQWMFVVALSAQALPGALVILAMEFAGKMSSLELEELLPFVNRTL